MYFCVYYIRNVQSIETKQNGFIHIGLIKKRSCTQGCTQNEPEFNLLFHINFVFESLFFKVVDFISFFCISNAKENSKHYNEQSQNCPMIHSYNWLLKDFWVLWSFSTHCNTFLILVSFYVYCFQRVDIRAELESLERKIVFFPLKQHEFLIYREVFYFYQRLFISFSKVSPIWFFRTLGLC